ncbi:MAG: DUF2314 domain-containing protein [Flavobacteriaceae bacterium]
MKNNSRIYFIVIAASIAIYGLYWLKNRSVESRIESDWDINNTREIDVDDEALAKSERMAQKNLSYFIAEFRNKNDNSNEFYVKVKLTEDGVVEHMWIDILELDGDQSIGLLDNDPLKFKRLKYLDTVKFDINKAEDLMMYENDSLKLGGFLQAELGKN